MRRVFMSASCDTLWFARNPCERRHGCPARGSQTGLLSVRGVGSGDQRRAFMPAVRGRRYEVKCLSFDELLACFDLSRRSAWVAG